jgi:hypothetical protein
MENPTTTQGLKPFKNIDVKVETQNFFDYSSIYQEKKKCCRKAYQEIKDKTLPKPTRAFKQEWKNIDTKNHKQ